ncbi:hypothetical protein PG996_014000 [Apiospora saccharicola]|uniref:Uncharacterized protein n=1 Tax=Apiospora saccharicola TaxID=335842 RepID=A0ABR1TIZ7_9PEZI
MFTLYAPKTHLSCSIVSDLVKWNTWVRAEWRCDSDLYEGMADSHARPVCVGVEDSGSTTGGSLPSPAPST